MGVNVDVQRREATLKWQKQQLKSAEESPTRKQLSGEAKDEYERMISTLRHEIILYEETLSELNQHSSRQHQSALLKAEIDLLADKLGAGKSPPAMTQKLYSLSIPAGLREAALGDREEIYRKDVARHGLRWAVWLYRWDALLALAALLKRGVSHSALIGAGGAIMKWLGSGG